MASTPPTPPNPGAQAPKGSGPFVQPCGPIDPSSLELALGTLQTRLDMLQQALAQQNKLSTLGMITAVIAHEFNNILTPMISYTTYALGDKADEALRTKALQKALSGAERLSNISKSLLGFTSGEESTSANVAAAVRDTLSCLARDPAKDGITLSLQIPDTLHVAMNAGQLQQVLMNLVVNARSAMISGPSGAAPSLSRNPATPGTPSARAAIEASRRSPTGPKRLTISATLTGDLIEIRVSDTGPGIPAEVLPRIFEPFFSTKRRGEPTSANAADHSSDEAVPRGGTGLGLTICHELVAATGGSIEALSEPGKGATFVLKIPPATAPSTNPTSTARAPSTSQTSTIPPRTPPTSVH